MGHRCNDLTILIKEMVPAEKYVNASDVMEYVEMELWRRRGDRYEVVSFNDMKDIVQEAIDRADYVEVDSD